MNRFLVLILTVVTIPQESEIACVVYDPASGAELSRQFISTASKPMARN